MNYQKNLISGIFSVVIFIGFCTIAKGKSIYLVGDTELSILRAYKITGTALNYQTQYQLQPSGVGIGAVGLAMNESDYGNYIFVTSEKSGRLYILNAKTMQLFDFVDIYQATDLAGIASDQGLDKIYMMDRYSNHLFSYTWHPLLHNLVPDFSSYIELQDMEHGKPYGAFGISLDDINNLLYVADNTNKIKYYNTSDWSKAGEINVDCNVISIALDVNRYSLYYGSIGGTYGDGDFNLYKYNLSTGSGQHVLVGSSVVGISVDKDTGYVYITTFGDGNSSTQSRIMIYDSNLVKQSYDSGNIGNPAGILVPSGNIEYKPPSFTFAKIDINSPNSVVPGDNITYRITYGPNGISHNNVVIRDFLPGEVNIINPSDPNYNATKHTYTWNIGPISAGAANNTVDINVQVNNGADPNGIITNYCEIESDVAYNTATCSTNVGPWEPNSDIIYVDFLSLCSPGTGVSWRYAYRDFQDALDSAATGRGSQIWVKHGIYLPTALDSTFTVYRGIPIYGHFAGNETSLSQRNLNDANNQSNLTGIIGSTSYIVSILNQDLGNELDGFTIRWALVAGVYLEDANLYITNCKVASNNYNGIESSGSNFTVSNCDIINNYTGIIVSDSNFTIFDCNVHNNDGYGIHSTVSNFTVFDCNVSSNGNGGIYDSGIYAINSHFTVAGSVIQDNGQYGIYANLQYAPIIYKTEVKNNIIRNNNTGVLLSFNQSPVDANILNNLIYNNNTGIDFITNSGHDYDAVIQNNTVVKNYTGIMTSSSWYMPIIRNCIFWGNSTEIDGYGYTAFPTYCCIEEDYPGQYPGQGNIFTDPRFVGYASNDFHLKYDSNCIDAGDPNVDYDDQTDIDGQCRVIYGKSAEIVDIGADEYFMKADYNGDSIVNFNDFAILAPVWKSNNSPSITLDEDNDVDINDLELFCNVWLCYAPCFPISEMLAEQSQGDSGMAASTELVEQTPPAETVEEPVNDTSAVAPTEDISQPVSDEQIQFLIDWAEQIWQTDPELQEMIDPNDYQRMIDSLQEELND